MQLEGYGLAVGNNADMVVLQAHDTIEAIRLRARRLFVIRRGKVISEMPAEHAGARSSGPAQDPRSRRLFPEDHLSDRCDFSTAFNRRRTGVIRLSDEGDAACEGSIDVQAGAVDDCRNLYRRVACRRAAFDGRR